MDPELYKMTMAVVSDSIKILGPAIITAIVGYKAGKSQLLLKLEELNKNNEFTARERIFDFHKEKLAKIDESITILNEGLGQCAGMTLADMDDQMNLSLFVKKYVILYIRDLPYQLDKISDEMEKYSDEFISEREQLREHIERSIDIKEPTTPEEITSVIAELIENYRFVSRCIRLLIEKEAFEIFKPYISKV